MIGHVATLGAGLVYLPDPRREMIKIKDIAQSLSRQCRFNGHGKYFYSVAEHCVLGASMYSDPSDQFAFLLHDAHETYTGDIVSPVKAYCNCRKRHDTRREGPDGLQELEHIIQIRINSYYGVSVPTNLNYVDSLMLGHEIDWMFPEMAWVEKAVDVLEARRAKEKESQWIFPTLEGWDPVQAEAEFMDTFLSLMKEI